MHQVTLADVLRDHSPQPARFPRGRLRGVPAGLPRPRRPGQPLGQRAGRRRGGRGRPLALARTELPPPPRRAPGGGQSGRRLLPGQLAPERRGIRLRLADADPSVVFWQEAEIGETLRQVRRDTGLRGAVAPARRGGRGELRGLHRRRPRHRSRARVDESTAVLMMYTAAFTGSPNGALLSHRALVVQGSFMAQIQGVGADYVYLNCGPLFHVATFMTTLATFLSGGTNVFTPRADAEELCRLIADEGCTGGFIMGAHDGPDHRAQRRRPVQPEDAARLRGQARVDGHDHRRHERLGTAAGRLRPDRGHGDGHAERPGAVHRLERAARSLRPDRHAQPRGPGAAGRRGRRDRCPGPHRDERVLQPARTERRASGRWVAPHQRPRAGSRSTVRSPSWPRRAVSSSRRPRTSTRPRSRPA